MEVRIENIAEIKLAGMKANMQMSDNKTFELWHKFMSHKKYILNNISEDLYSVQLFNPELKLENFNQNTYFTKWAAIEVADFETIEPFFETLIIPNSMYASYLFIGTPDQFPASFQQFISNWLMPSQYILDERPHFQIMGKNYRNNDPNSEEMVFIPIKMK